MPRSPEEMSAAIIANLPEKTGRTLEEWVRIAREEGPPEKRERVAWLKSAHGLGHVTASLVAGRAARSDAYVPKSGDELVDAQYAGPKAALRPVYDRLAEEARGIAADVDVSPRKTYVALVRARQFGVVQATTRARVDLGLALPGVEPAGRLEAVRGLGSERITHRVSLTAPEQVDAEVVGWMREAYARGG